MDVLVGDHGRPGREARALQYQKRCKAGLAAPASSWELSSQQQVLVGLPQYYLHPEVKHYKLLLFQISGDTYPYEDPF